MGHQHQEKLSKRGHMGLPQSRRLAQEHHLNSQLTLTSLFQNQLHKLHYIIVFFVYLFVCPCFKYLCVEYYVRPLSAVFMDVFYFHRGSDGAGHDWSFSQPPDPVLSEVCH